MHDWTLNSLLVDWQKGKVTISFKYEGSNEAKLVGNGLVELKVTKREEWGESSSINEVDGPSPLENGNFYISIEIQSGDLIKLEARSISISKECTNNS